MAFAGFSEDDGLPSLFSKEYDLFIVSVDDFDHYFHTERPLSTSIE